MDLSSRIGVDAGEVLVVAFARLKRAVPGVVWRIVGTSNTVEDVLAEVPGVGASGVTGLEAKEVSAVEVVPLDDLFEVALVVTTPRIREDQTTERVSSEIGTMRVHLPSIVVRGEVGLCLVNKPDDLDVVGGPHKLDALESTTRDESCAVTGFGTPCDGLVLGFADGGRAIRRGPETKIID